MGDKSKFDELLISYLLKELDAEDEEFVVEWINLNEENKRYFEEFYTIWKLTSLRSDNADINVNDEWTNFKRTINNKQQENYLFKQVANLVEETANIGKGKRQRIYKIAISTAVAALAIFVIAIAFGILKNDKGEKETIAKLSNGKADVAVQNLRNTSNQTNKKKRLVLKDGTQVTLLPGSRISYYEPFINNRRDITLNGKALFKVAKDKTRPFTVSSGDLSTTALGTRFTVTAFKGEKNIVVRLFEGKVVVKPRIALRSRLQNEYDLLPGQELIYNNVSSIGKIRKFNERHRNAARIGDNTETFLPPETLSIPIAEKGSWFMFNNQSLVQVFQQLENMYDVKIFFSKKEVANKYFIGTFGKSEPVENVLKQIAAVNNLKVQKRNDMFIIRK